MLLYVVAPVIHTYILIYIQRRQTGRFLSRGCLNRSRLSRKVVVVGSGRYFLNKTSRGCLNNPPSPLRPSSCCFLYHDQNAKNGTEAPTEFATPLNPRTPLGAGSSSSGTGRRQLGGGGGDVGAPSTGRSTTFNPVSSAEPYFRPFNVTPSSVSQFVQAEASRGSPSPLLTHQSPVLNTEELYRAAGWMTPLPKDAVNRDSGGGGGGDNSDDDEMMTDAGSKNSRLAVLSAKNEQHDTSQRMAHSLALGTNGGGGDRSGAAAAATAAGAAAAEAEAAAVDAGMRTADRIRDEIAREPVLSLANLAGFGGEPGDGGAKAAGGSGGSDDGGGSSGEGAAGTDPLEEDGSAEEPGIPKSIAEIYEVYCWWKKGCPGCA